MNLGGFFTVSLTFIGALINVTLGLYRNVLDSKMIGCVMTMSPLTSHQAVLYMFYPGSCLVDNSWKRSVRFCPWLIEFYYNLWVVFLLSSLSSYATHCPICLHLNDRLKATLAMLYSCMSPGCPNKLNYSTLFDFV